MARLIAGLCGLAITTNVHTQAYRVKPLETFPETHTWSLGLTDAGDVVGRSSNRYAVWQSTAEFGRPAGFTPLHEIGDALTGPSLTEHIDDAGYWYGSSDGRASVWSQSGGHEALQHNPRRQSRAAGGSWPALVVGYELDETYLPQPVAWLEGAMVQLEIPSCATAGAAKGANTNGIIVGEAHVNDPNTFERVDEAGVIWIKGEAIELDDLVVGFSDHIVQAVAINTRGQIAVNVIDDGGIWRPALLEPAGADLNGNGSVGSDDFNAWLGFASAEDRRGDVNGDGLIDTADMMRLIGMIQRPPPRAAAESDPERRARQLASEFLTAGVYDEEISLSTSGVALHPIQPGNWNWQQWFESNNWNEYHPEFNPNCYGCSGDDPDNPHAPDGAPGWPGNDPGNPYKPNGGPGGPGADGDPAGDGGNGGAGKDGDGNREPGNGGPGGTGGDNTDDGPGGDAGDGGNGGDGGNEQPGGDGGTGGDGGNGGPNGGNSGDGGDGGNGGSGGPGIRPGSGAPGGPGGNGGDAGDSPNGDAGNGGDGGPGGTGGSGHSGPGGSGGAGGDAGSGGDAPNGDGGNGGSGGNGGTGGTGDGPGGDGGSGGGGGNGGDGGDGNSNGGNGGSGGGEGSGGSGGTGSPNGNDGGDGNGGSDGSP